MNATATTQGRPHPCAWAVQLLSVGMLLPCLLVGCTSPVTEQRQTPPGPVATSPAATTANAALHNSQAPHARAYRQDAARHLYLQQKDRVYKGRLPPMLYAVGVLQVDIDRQGQIQALKWTRAPQHAPEVVAEIERMVHAAAPFPAPSRLGKVTYTDVWLWDKSGRFQLDTLTEGQD